MEPFQSGHIDEKELCSRCYGTMYKIEKGDTLYSISKKYNVKISALILANPYINVYNLKIGTTICIPYTKEENIPAVPGNEEDLPNMTPDHDNPDEMSVKELLEKWDISYELLERCLSILKKM